MEKRKRSMGKKKGSTVDDQNLVSQEELGEQVQLRIISLKNNVLFPNNVMPVTAGKEMTMEAVDLAIRTGGNVGIVSQKTGDTDTAATPSQLYMVGTEAKVLKVMRFPDNSYGVVFQGMRRFKIHDFVSAPDEPLTANVVFVPEEDILDGDKSEKIELLALGKSLKQLVQKAVGLSPNIPAEANLFVENVEDPSYLADLVAPYLSIDLVAKQGLLEVFNRRLLLKKVHYYLVRELEILEISQKLYGEVKSEITKQQKKFYLREQLKLIHRELSELEGTKGSTASGGSQPSGGDFTQRMEQVQMPADVREVAVRELDRMNMMQPGSAEYMVSHTYLGCLLDIPWGIHTQKPVSLSKAQIILDADHHGLEKIKKRILEFLAVYTLNEKIKGPILLLVGPPGVGKTSLGKSLAKALGRGFERIALGGVRDEAEIRGHRRTYVGSMPGKIVQALKKAKSMDPVILLDEVDKMSGDFRGDPASALLEVLDPEQNHIFNDHYLGVSIDLSQVIFICTANSLQSIPAPLLDRMERIEMSGYTLQEKEHIALKHLVPQTSSEHGDVIQLQFPVSTLKSLIQDYTYEAGVRDLKRKIAGIFRGFIMDYIQSKQKKPKVKGTSKFSVTLKSVHQYLGTPIHLRDRKPKSLPAGVATGLAYTPMGGDVLFIETVGQPGTGKLAVTGQLGDVMKESASTAMAYVQSHAKSFGLTQDLLKQTDVHIHFPAGGVKKDGPSAGIAIFLALMSQYRNKSLPSNLAFTGEISLRGQVLPVGGIKEKVIAAHRYGIHTVYIPHENKRDMEEVPNEVKEEMNFVFVKTMDETLRHVFP